MEKILTELSGEVSDVDDECYACPLSGGLEISDGKLCFEEEFDVAKMKIHFQILPLKVHLY